MEIVDNLELLKEGDYLRISGRANNSYPLIVKVKEQKDKEIVCDVIAEERIKVHNDEPYLFFWDKKISEFRLLKFIKKPKKRKLKDKKYSNNPNHIIFKLNESEIDKIIKEAILSKL